jgi:TANFOR domain-containing protein
MMMMGTTSALAQLAQTVTVMPPYSNRLSDYIATPGKISSVITVTGMDWPRFEIYLHGSIISSDESVIIRSGANNKPAAPILITPVVMPSGARIFLPYTLTYQDILQIFNEQQLTFKGITRQEVMQNGLPEGSYALCFDIIDYNGGQSITSSCSNMFNVSSVEAPMIISPMHQTLLRAPEAKNVVFSWTRPANAPLQTQYRLKIIELAEGVGNYQDLIRSSGYPAFFETTVTGNTYLYSAANPPLKEGRTYAFVVAAVDPMGSTAFRNKGFSEVNLFTYQPEEQKPMSGTLPGGVNTGMPTLNLGLNQEITPVALSFSTLKGVLVYKYNNTVKTTPLAKTKIKLVTKYIVKHADGTLNEVMTRNRFSQAPYKDGQVVATTTTGDNGAFSFVFLSNSKGEPLADTDCAKKLAQADGPAMRPDADLYADISYRFGKGGPNPGGMIVSSGTSGDNACKLYLGYAIEIEGEHARYYLNPDQEMRFFFEVKGGETKEVGEVVSLVRTIDLNVQVKAATSNLTINDSEELANMNVFLFRKINFDYPPIFPTDDVTPDKTDNFPAPVAAMVCVGKGLTGKDGTAKIRSLVLNDNPTYQYYLYINNSQDYNYESDAPLRIDFADLLKAETNTPSPGGMYNIDRSTPGYQSMLDNRSASDYFGGDYSSIANGFDLEVALEAKYPTLRVTLQEPDGLKKLEQYAQVTLTEKYSDGHAMASPTAFRTVQGNETIHTPMTLYDTGIYEHRDAAVELASAPTRIVGPGRTVTVKTAGFADTTFTVNNGNPLKMGERYEMLITLRYGALFTGTVIDAETRKPLPNAAVKIVDEMSKVSTTNNDGTFSIEARKLSGLRTVEIFRTGYITDTVNVTLDKSNNLYHFELYRKTRRLRVEVWAKNNYQEGIVVALPDVPNSWKTDYGKLPEGQSATGTTGGLLPGTGQQITVPQGALTQGTLPQGSAQQGAVTITPGVVARKIHIPSSPQTPPSGQSSKSKLTEKSASSQVSAATPGIGAAQLLQQEPQEYHLITGTDGVADFAFEGGQSDRFRVVLTNSPGATDLFPKVIKEVDIPYVKDYQGTFLRVVLEEGSCLTGTVYLGEGDNKPQSGIDVTATITGEDEAYTLTTKTDAAGRYRLANLPAGRPFKLQVSTDKAGNSYVGYNNDAYSIATAGTTCQTEDFHMQAVDGVELSTFLGFPFAPTDFSEQSDGSVLLTGTITLPANSHFGEQKIDISNVKMVKSGVKNSSGDELLLPATLPFVTDKNNLIVTLPGDYKAVITDDTGLKLDLYDKEKVQGEMKAGVQINEAEGNTALNANFGGSGYTLPDLFLAASPGTTDARLTVFHSAGQISSTNMGSDGFYLSDGQNETLTYSIDGFENNAVVQSTESYFDKNGLSLRTKLKASIANLNPSNIELDAGTIRISKQGLTTVDPQPFSLKMGSWTLKCNNWAVTGEGVSVSHATLSTGMDVKIEHLGLTSQALVTDKAIVHMESVRLLGVKDLAIQTTRKGLVYKYLHDGVYGWSLYATPDAGQTIVATLQGMPGVAPADKIEFVSVDINSEGESILALNSHTFRLYNIVDFTPFPSTQMYVTPSSLKLKGTYDFGIPNYVKPSGAMGFFREGNNIAFDMMDMDAFRFTHHNVLYDLTYDYTLADGLFTAKGTAEEPGHLPSLHVTLRHTPAETRINIDSGEKLPMGAGKELANLTGGIGVVANAWDVLRFVGDVKGLNNIDAGQKMNFEVRGAVQATGQQIGVSDIPSFPGLSITYDLPNARFIGNASLDINLGGMILQGSMNTVMDSQGWLFNALGMVEIPGIGSANLYGLFGNYINMPPDVSARIGNAVCLPASFKTNLSGFFLSAELTRQILPKVSYNYGVVSVTAGVDVSVNARTYMIFGQGTTFDMGVLAEGHAYLGGSCPATCTSAHANSALQLGISGDYNSQTHFYNIDGCSSLNLEISASQCLPVLVGCGPCVSITLADFTIGASVHLDNTNGFSMGITTQSCDEQCK